MTETGPPRTCLPTDGFMQAFWEHAQHSPTTDDLGAALRTGYRPHIPATPALFFPPGHYYSPVVDPSSLPWPLPRSAPLGITIDYGAMEALYHALLPYLTRLALPRTATATHRYYTDNHMYDVGDAMIYAGLLGHLRPRRVIEVGSGFSSALLLDILDRTPGLDTQVTFIEPYSDRLEALLKPADHSRVRLIRRGVQDVPLTVFDALGVGDILFLDTTHIVKTGSDVNYELFEILPRLVPGVWVHFHDVFPGFEYPDHWVFTENRSWNELYALRAFLQYNNAFRIGYFNAAFGERNHALIRRTCPDIMRNVGGGLWLRKV